MNWIDLRENLQETIDFTMKLVGLKPANFPIIQFIDKYVEWFRLIALYDVLGQIGV